MIIAGLYIAFAKKQQLTTMFYRLKMMPRSRPAMARAEEVEAIRQWVRTCTASAA